MTDSTASATAKASATYELGITIIRADGTVEEIGTVGSTAWGRFSPRYLRPWFRIKRANWRHRRNLREA